jgi:hypothetical protein
VGAPGVKLLTLEIGANAPCGIVRVPFEYARVSARDTECSEWGEGVERGVVQECVRRECASSFRNRRCCRSSGFTCQASRFRRGGDVMTALAEGTDRDRWMREKREGRQQLQRRISRKGTNT